MNSECIRENDAQDPGMSRYEECLQTGSSELFKSGLNCPLGQGMVLGIRVKLYLMRHQKDPSRGKLYVPKLTLHTNIFS